jgi:Asp-tRNA(Asn)/Glu-tRNA(Gln) amidotransferase A subunit family amidase
VIADLVRAVRTKEVHPREVVAEAIQRIEAHNPALNAVVDNRFEQALVEAESVDLSTPLAGVPMLAKNLLDVKDIVSTHGGFSPSANHPAQTRHDPSLQAIVDQGAVVIGVTNSPVFGLLGITTNEMFGVTRNPWNPAKTPGGSSGGAAASLASGMVPLSGSTDGGGSTRMPAAACGLVGLKPTSNAFRSTWPPNLGWASSGAMGVSVADVQLEAECMAGATPGDPNGMPRGSVDFAPRRPRRVYAVSSLRHKSPTPNLQKHFDDACALISDVIGIEVVSIARPFPDDLVNQFELVFNANFRHLVEASGARADQLDAAQSWAFHYSEKFTAAEVMTALHGRAAINSILEEVLGPDDVLITLPINIHIPGALGVPEGIDPNDAAAAMAVLEEELDGAANTMDFNLAGAPACVVPIGMDHEHMPVGLQIAARRFNDGLTLGLAREIEQAQPWPLVAPGYSPFGLS